MAEQLWLPSAVSGPRRDWYLQGTNEHGQDTTAASTRVRIQPSVSRHPSREPSPRTTSTLAPAPGTFESESEPSREPAPKSGTKPPGTTSTLAPRTGDLEGTYAPTTVYLDEIDRDAMKHVFSHRDKAEMAWGMGDEKDEKSKMLCSPWSSPS